MSEPKPNASINKTMTRLLTLVVAMFGFGFLLVPIYDVICDLTGINGKVDLVAYEKTDEVVDETRTINIQFIAMNNDGMSWKFKPNHTTIGAHPGQSYDTTFYALNPTTQKMIAQAIPSVTPGYAAKYFHKTECFCFNQQELEGGEDDNMGLSFVVDTDLPEGVKTITLTYTLFDVTDQFQVASTD